jgi:hypothetical protein
LVFKQFELASVVLILITSLLMLVTLDWRLSIMALAMQYVGAFLLVMLSWPLEMAVAKLVAGWMAGAVLGMAIAGMPHTKLEEDVNLPIPSLQKTDVGASNPSLEVAESGPHLPAGRLFRLLAAALVVLIVLSAAPQLVNWVGEINLEQAWGGLILIGMGLLQLGFTSRTFKTVIGLLTVLSGFEILYAAVESSALVAGLLSGVNLMLALTGSYLLTAPFMEAE